MGLTITRAAQKLGVTQQALSEVLNERKGLSPELARRLAEVFGSTAETWLGMQMAYDQWQAHGVSSHATRNPGAPGQAPAKPVKHLSLR